ncbi:MAG: autotransporter outer membrane beta-barrel domain-containing protein [Reyranella sp.]|nr:autotransporter outer membrane beta-barrel domain-containing protein [Reyranella sp.]MBL6650799.1 autotransporter outer membrane beta-barrel domain-containing protein [Reyranella sp.]
MGKRIALARTFTAHRNQPDETASAIALMAASLLTSAVAMAAFATTPARAQNATWLGANPGDTSFNTPGNWTPASVPTGTASFGPATVTNPNIFGPTTNTLNQFQFVAGAPAYSIGVFGTLNLNNGGVTGNASGNAQNIIVLSGGTLNFNSSTAGDNTISYGNRGGAIVFNGGSTAGGANFENQTGGGTTGTITFNNGSSAGSSLIRNNFGAGSVIFAGTSTAGGATIINDSATGGGNITFTNTSNAGSATIQNMTAGNNIAFLASSNAGNATILNSTGSNLNLFGNSSAGTSTITNIGTTTFGDSATAAQANITNVGTLNFTATSAAGQSTITNNGTTTFSGSASAAQANITNSGTLNFTATSAAGQSTITNNGTTTFSASASAAQANITNNAALNFRGTSTGGTATIVTNGGGITSFFDSATGGAAQFIANSGGVVDISTLTSAGMTAGSIAGAGNYFLGSKVLTVGLNNLSTTVSGVIADQGVAGGTGGSLVKVGTGTLTLPGANTYTGLTTISAGAINLTGSLQSPVNVQPAGTLGSTGTVFNTVTNAGTVMPGFGLPAGQFGALTVNGYVGRNGTLALNTFLAGDGSPSDRLVISGGGATGNSLIRITNVGGGGAETTNGIPVVVVTNSGSTDPNAFTLANAELRAGFFDYRLFRGAVDGSSPNDWFLRNDFVGAGGSGNGPIAPGNELPSDPAPSDGPPPPGLWPIIGPELATYGVVQPIARQMGLLTLGTLHERIGDTAADAACLNAPSGGVSVVNALSGTVSDEKCRPAAWGRLLGQQIYNRYQAFADPRATGRLLGIQAGIDVWRGSLISDHSDTAGVYFAFGNGYLTVDGLVTNTAATAYALQYTGSLNLNAYSVGGYWTHYGPTGWYVDAVLQGSFYSGNAWTQFANLPIKGSGFTASLEAGYPIPLARLGPGFVLEPQWQVLWQQVSFEDSNDGLGTVGLGTTSGPSGRLGLRGKWTISDGAGRIWQPYVRGNVWRDWGARATTMFGVEAVPLVEETTRLEFAGGLSAKLFSNVSLFAQGGYQFGTSNQQRRNGVKADLGVRYSW